MGILADFGKKYFLNKKNYIILKNDVYKSKLSLGEGRWRIKYWKKTFFRKY